MRFDFKGKHYRMWFRHTLYDKPRIHVQRNNGRERIVKGETVCEIGVLDGEYTSQTKREDFRVVSSGTSWCAVSDTFKDDQGRTDALKRALDNLGRNLANRQVIEIGFVAYTTRPRPKHADYLKQEVVRLKSRVAELEAA